jgi:hypothetical protein
MLNLLVKCIKDAVLYHAASTPIGSFLAQEQQALLEG